MSALKKFLKQLELSGQGIGHSLDSASGAAMAKSPRLSGVLDRLAGAAHKYPKSAAVGGTLVAPTALGFGASAGAGDLDRAMTGGDEIPPEMIAALESAGQNPKDFEDDGTLFARGAVGGASAGSIAHLLKGRPKGALAKFLGLGALGGGVLGSGITSYTKKEE